MKSILTFLCLIATLSSFAQTSIGTTTPNASAKLDVTSATQGFLPPRVVLTGTTDNTTIKSSAGTSIVPATGLLVFNTATAGTAPNNVIPGYYYWSGTAWTALMQTIGIDNSKTSSFTLAAADNNKILFINSASAVAITIPNALSIGFSCQFVQVGNGILTLVGSGVTLNTANGLSTRSVNSVIGVVMNLSTSGFVFGDSMY